MIDTTKMTDNEILNWIKEIKKDLRKKQGMKRASESEFNEMIMDGMFDGFMEDELRRVDLANIARVLGFELSKEFMNDQNPEPYELKHKK